MTLVEDEHVCVVSKKGGFVTELGQLFVRGETTDVGSQSNLDKPHLRDS